MLGQLSTVSHVKEDYNSENGVRNNGTDNTYWTSGVRSYDNRSLPPTMAPTFVLELLVPVDPGRPSEVLVMVLFGPVALLLATVLIYFGSSSGLADPGKIEVGRRSTPE